MRSSAENVSNLTLSSGRFLSAMRVTIFPMWGHVKRNLLEIVRIILASRFQQFSQFEDQLLGRQSRLFRVFLSAPVICFYLRWFFLVAEPLDGGTQLLDLPVRAVLLCLCVD